MIKTSLMILPDVQSSLDRRDLPIERVGVKGVEFPILVKSPGGAQHTVARIEMAVALQPDRKGTHMSRFWTLLNGINEPFGTGMLPKVMADMLASLKAEGGHIRLDFPYFVEKEAPVSGLKSTMNYHVSLIANAKDGKTTVIQKVIVPVTSLCPCSKEISKYGAHNQRSRISLAVRVEGFYPVEKQIAIVEECSSCPVWSLLKRSDEKYVTEKAYENPKFVEDLVRDIALRCQEDSAVQSFEIQAENFESIHNHSAYAVISIDKTKKC